MKTFREILLLIRLANAELAVRSCQRHIERGRVDLEKAVAARDQAQADLNLVHVADSVVETPGQIPAFLERKDGPRP